LENSKYKVADLESIANLELQLDLAVIDEKNKKADVLFWKPKKEKNKQVTTAELTTLKSKRLMVLFDGSWQLVYYSGIL
jgi:hypothetical protein